MDNAKKIENNYILQDICQENEDVRSYVFFYGLTPFNYLPGQFVVVRLAAHPEYRASLTLSSSPSDQDQFELTVKRTGAFGTHFYDLAEIGSVVAMTLPTGPFTLKVQETRPICFLGRDYSIPAARSFLRYLRATGSQRQLLLVQELSLPSQILFEPELSAAPANFRWVQLCDPLSADAETLTLLLGGSEDWSFYIQAEGIEAKRYRKILESMGVASDKVLVERWS